MLKIHTIQQNDPWKPVETDAQNWMKKVDDNNTYSEDEIKIVEDGRAIKNKHSFNSSDFGYYGKCWTFGHHGWGEEGAGDINGVELTMVSKHLSV